MDDSEIDVRHMIVPRDMPEVLLIETESFEFPWTEIEFLQRLRCHSVGAMVADCGNRVAGFMIFELRKREICLENLAVSVECRRRGVGRGMIDWLKSRLSEERRSRVSLHIHERNLEGQFFFRAMGFRALSVAHAHFDNGEDAYWMVHELQADTTTRDDRQALNRVRK